MSPTTSSPSRVVLHVGAPKSGTTFLQQAVWGNREELATTGLHLPGGRQRDMFLAAVEVREGYRFWGYPAEEIDGTWRRLCVAAAERGGTTLMSHELLGAATEAQVQRALVELEGVELHVVFTARDLARQATSEWQERVKNGSSRSFAAYRATLEKQIASGDFAHPFWRNQDAVGALRHWAGHLPPERVHVVVAPAPGADSNVLWRRFGDAVGFDADDYDPLIADGPTNPTLGVTQVAVLRRVNEALAKQIPQPGYARVVKEYFVAKLLLQQRSPKPVCPAPLAELLRPIAQRSNDELVAAGYRVHGDLADLVPTPATDAAEPDDVDITEELEALTRAVADSLLLRDEQRRAVLARREERVRSADEPGAGKRSLGRRVANRLRR